MKTDTGGFTMPEALVSVFIFMLVISLSMTLLGFISKASARRLSTYELTENARSALDTITANVRRAERIRLTVNPGSALDQLQLWELNASDRYQWFIFEHLPAENTIRFTGDGGTNVLATAIAEVSASIKDGFLYIRVRSIPDAANPQGISLNSVIDIRFKEVV